MTADPFPPTETSRLRLRCVAMEDAEMTAALMTKAVGDWLASWPIPFTTEMARNRIELARNAASRGEALPYAITLKDNGTLAGWMTLARSESDHRRGSLGYWLGTRYHGQGYTREALNAVLASGFNMFGLNTIEAGAQPENIASLTVMRACGMTEIGKRMVHAASRGRDELCVFYEISRPLL